MKLLSEEELIWTTTVANNTMNRSRNAAGINNRILKTTLLPAPGKPRP